MKLKWIAGTHTIMKEKLISPFGFKGGYVDELWQSIVRLENEKGQSGIGLGVQSVLWSDSGLFAELGNERGNELMAALTSKAVELGRKHQEASSPFELLDHLAGPIHEEGCSLIDRKIRLTFALNALVPLDFAAWQLYAKQAPAAEFDKLIPKEVAEALPVHHSTLASTPIVSYGMSDEQILKLLDQGYFVLKLKLGADPDKDGNQDKMLEWDCRQLEKVHQLAKDRSCKHTDNGKIAYYLDLNCRYDSKQRVQALLDYAKAIGALEQILLLEEPFDEENLEDVSDLPVRVAADESVHSVEDAIERIRLGYGAFALKPVAKTLSLSLRVAKAAYDADIPCFCADLTASPWMVDWNKMVASRLKPLPGLKMGLLESNGHQNYLGWERMRGYHPMGHAEWTETTDGLYKLTASFYEQNGGIFHTSASYNQIVDQMGDTQAEVEVVRRL
ncbi:enolase C-terminal domain-like protein [Paenibacillus senegalensis]|uniref:enolase C-terminal domain-like protein n=1 Tax=Paenibacillus senegalensis TaxID=1465766 RepID=UPI000288B284|nr:enolase C-terminal domain-like protein [Paenibacillus senegalensis]